MPIVGYLGRVGLNIVCILWTFKSWWWNYFPNINGKFELGFLW